MKKPTGLRPLILPPKEQAKAVIEAIDLMLDFLGSHALPREPNAPPPNPLPTIRVHVSEFDFRFGHYDTRFRSFAGYPLNLHLSVPRQDELREALGEQGRACSFVGFTQLPIERVRLEDTEYVQPLPWGQWGWYRRMRAIREDAERVLYADAPTNETYVSDAWIVEYFRGKRQKLLTTLFQKGWVKRADILELFAEDWDSASAPDNLRREVVRINKALTEKQDVIGKQWQIKWREVEGEKCLKLGRTAP